MKFQSEDDAKNYSVDITSRLLRPEDAQKQLETYRSYYASAFTNEDKEYWLNELNRLKEYLNSSDFKRGKYPQGIDELIIELIEWRASIFAFQNVDTENDPFNEHAFYAQWLMGGAYVVFCILGKLVSKDNRDNSLRKLWENVSGYIENSGLCGNGEINAINEKMHRSNGHFTNNNSRAMLFRNKVIAHNESFPSLDWIEVDEDIKLLCRIWALITMWSSFGIIEPFKADALAFSGTESVFSTNEILLLQKQRRSYIDKIESWCTQNIVDGSKVSDRSPFGKISVSVKLHNY